MVVARVLPCRVEFHRSSFALAYRDKAHVAHRDRYQVCARVEIKAAVGIVAEQFRVVLACAAKAQPRAFRISRKLRLVEYDPLGYAEFSGGYEHLDILPSAHCGKQLFERGGGIFYAGRIRAVVG